MSKRLEDIAKDLGMSIATVSRALNKKTADLVKDETRKKILEHVRETGFKPNVKASALAKGKLTNLFLILSQREESIFFDQYFMKIIRGIQNVIFDTEFSLVILSIDETYTKDEIYEILLKNETAGLILSSHCSSSNIFPPDLFKGFDFPIVSLDHEIEGENIYNIMLDHKNAGYKAAELLAGKYKNIVLISDASSSFHSEMRKSGFLEYFEQFDNNEYNLIDLKYPLSQLSGLPALEKVIDLNNFPVGVFALSDEIACEMVNHIAIKGLRCPADIGILGFDGLSIGRYVYPRLRSVIFPINKVGQISARIILDVLSKKKLSSKISLQAGITEGDSC